MILQVVLVALVIATATATVQTVRLEKLKATGAQSRYDQFESDRLQEKVNAQKARGVDSATQNRIEHYRRLADDTDRVALGLRDALSAAAASRAASAPGCSDDRNALARMEELFGTCSALLAEGAKRGDRIAAQVEGFQDLLPASEPQAASAPNSLLQ